MVRKDQDEWISNLEGLWICMADCGLKDKMIDNDIIIQILSNWPEKCDVILDGLGIHLKSFGHDELTIEVIHEKK